MSEAIKELFAQPTFERALLSYCVKSVENYYTIAANIEYSDFLRPEHRLLFMIIGTLVEKGIQRFDAALIANEAEKNGVAKDVGGYEYIDAILAAEFGEENISYYLEKVLDTSNKYKLHTRLDKHIRKLEKEGADEDVSAMDFLNSTEASLMELSSTSKTAQEPRNIADGLRELIEYRRENPVESCGIPTGFPVLDKRIDGLVPGTLQIVSARPKHGKSTLLSCISANIAIRRKIPTLYVDTEMPFEQWRDRMVAMLSEVEELTVKHGGYTDAEYRKILKAIEIIEKGKLWHEFMPGYQVDKLITLYKKYKYKEDIGLAVFDYIKEPTKSSSGGYDRKEYQLLGDVTTALKDLSGELNIPVLAASQLNREGKIADSDRLLRYADVLMRLEARTDEEMNDIKPYEARYGTYKLIITDSRRGGTTPAKGIGLAFRKKILLIHEAQDQLVDYDSQEFLEKEEMTRGPSMYDESESTTRGGDSSNEDIKDF